MRAEKQLLLLVAALAGSAACARAEDAPDPACTTSSQCPWERPLCSPAGSCEPCPVVECSGSSCPDKGWCGCRDDADCPDARPFCTAAKECAACDDSGACFVPARDPVILIVQDRSGSMDACFGTEGAQSLGEGCGVDADGDGIPDTATRSRMDVAQLVMQDAVSRHPNDVLYGLLLYGVSGSNQACGEPVVAVPVNTDTGDDLQGMYASDPRLERPQGGAPTTSALRAAYAELVDPATDSLKNPDRSNYVLLITDGLMNCNSEHPFPCRCSLETGCPGGVALGGELGGGQPEQCLDDDGAIAEVRRLAGKGIKTFVLGLGNLATDPVAVEVLNALAFAGEVPRQDDHVIFYPATDREALQRAIDSFFDSVVVP